MAAKAQTRGSKDLVLRARRVKLLAMDVDGVMTDGKILVSADGTVSKRFDIRDGHGLVMLREEGIELAILSGRDDGATTRRAADLKIAHVVQGLRKKLPAAHELAKKLGITLDEIAYVGDDVNDVGVIGAVGLGCAPADAALEARAAARFVTKSPGGNGAVREISELLLKSRGAWKRVVDGMR